jgi:acetyl/propionyl-CoA carboxylase alpha subunit
VQQAGIEFIGPPAEAIRSMGSKKESKEIMIGTFLDNQVIEVGVNGKCGDAA